MQPYENQLIGAFLLCLGFEAARMGHSVPPSANLFQQTPGDTCYGDLLVSCKTITLIEFKRTADDARSERSKYHALPKNWNKPIPMDSDIYHHLVYGDPSQPLRMAFAFYRSAFFTLKKETIASMGAALLISALLSGRVGGDAKLVDAYLKELNAGRKRKGDSGSNGALCFVGRKEDGTLCVVAESSLEKLLEHGHSVGRHADARTHLAPELERD